MFFFFNYKLKTLVFNLSTLTHKKVHYVHNFNIIYLVGGLNKLLFEILINSILTLGTKYDTMAYKLIHL